MAESADRRTVPRAMSRVRTLSLTALAMVAFAGNSLLCRMALKHTAIDPATFTAVRIASGAIVLTILVRLRGGTLAGRGSWRSALTLIVYAIAFSFAYVTLPASTGALLLFGAVQATMIGAGVAMGERPNATQIAGIALAVIGLVVLLAPGLSAPPAAGAALMVLAGVFWGIYSLRGRGAGDPAEVTAGNFARAAPFALAAALLYISRARIDAAGAGYAVASGALASGVGYVIWYTALRGLRATSAAVVQLSVPVIASFGGYLLLGEPITPRLAIASVAILGGIAMVVGARHR